MLASPGLYALLGHLAGVISLVMSWIAIQHDQWPPILLVCIVAFVTAWLDIGAR
jgi:hypothetical protein